MECNVAKPSSMTIHALLNDGADPNIGDENDYSNCPLHYCARYCSTKIANMLLEASCKMNKVSSRRRASPPAIALRCLPLPWPHAYPQENELGVTPLSMLCMFNQPEPRQKKYLEFVVWMLDNGSDINHVDKGGHTPLDIAASNGNMKLVSLLLQRGARVRREVEFLSIKVPSAVDTAANDDIRHLIERQLGLENDAEAVRKQEALRARLLALAEEEMAGKASNNKVWYTRQNREDAQRQKQSYEHTKRLEGEKRKLRIAEKAARLSMLSKKEASFGVWEKNKEVRGVCAAAVAASYYTPYTTNSLTHPASLR
jgi:ankyrin repeat protein